MKKWIKKKLNKLFLAEKCPKKLAQSFCLGTFIALSPTIPLQTPLVLLFSWLFKLNTSVSVAVLYTINNPLTMIPFYVLDYVVGSWLLKHLLPLPPESYNPSWAVAFSAFINRFVSLKNYLGTNTFCFWCLVVGGIVVPLVTTIIIYPIVKKLFTRVLTKLPSHSDI